MRRIAILAPIFAIGMVSVRAQVAMTLADPNGVSVPYAFAHLQHGEGESEGTTGWLRRNDPFLLYQLGRDLVNRMYMRSEGALGRPGEMSVPLYVDDALDAANVSRVRFSRDHTSSCGFCHSIPAREPGGGQTISSTSAMGRNTPHFYGAGVVEMIGEQVRTQILASIDRDRNGRIDRGEAMRGGRILIAPAPGLPKLDFGTPMADRFGVPQLNSAIRIWFVDANGIPLRDVRGFDDPRTAAFAFAMQPFGWGRGHRFHAGGRMTSEGGEAATIRGLVALAADVHMGLSSDDDSQRAEHGFGVARTSLSGAQQFDFDAQVREHGSDLTAGDLDAIEHYMLHAPEPAVLETKASLRGRAVLRDAGCTRCHVERWRIESDRRLFRVEPLTIAQGDGRSEIAARLVRTPKRGATLVENVFSDFRQWDIGPQFHERRYDGSLQKEHRTAPLWGAGSTKPYGHDGRFERLDDVIRAHGGAAFAERESYVALPEKRRAELLAFLESLVLWPTDEVSADIDGDGIYSDDFLFAGEHVGPERFDARLLFAVKPRFRILWDVTDATGRWRRLLLVDNVDEAYRRGGAR